MNPTQTGIAVALAVVVVAVFFIFPGLSPVGAPPKETTSPTAVVPTQGDSLQIPKNAMPQGPVTKLEGTDQVVGTGAVAAAGDTVTVNYVGAFTNGTVFDASANHGTAGFSFPLGAGRVIKGWDEGVVGMKEGGKRLLVIPGSLAYGSAGIKDPSTGQYVIPPDATLVFEVELVKVTKGAQ